MRIEKSWGYEQLIHNGNYCMKILVYVKAIASSLHYHIFKEESFYVSSGIFEIETAGGHPRRLAPGDWVVIPRATEHRVRCIHPGIIVEASTHDDPLDCVRIVPSET
jgi:quercetin dioxygenase-like cupin family protein